MKDTLKEKLIKLTSKMRSIDSEAAMIRWQLGKELNTEYGFLAGPGHSVGRIPAKDVADISHITGLGYVVLVQTRKFHKTFQERSEAEKFANECGSWTAVKLSLHSGDPNVGKKMAKGRSYDGGFSVTIPADFARELRSAGYTTKQIQRAMLLYFNFPEIRDDFFQLLKEHGNE